MMFNIETIIVYTYGDCNILLIMVSDISPILQNTENGGIKMRERGKNIYI